MTTTIISNMQPYTYGQMTNQAIGRLISLNTSMIRLQEAIATASAGYTGIEGTQFEIGNPTLPSSGDVMQPRSIGMNQNLFGVQASDTPGEQGSNYRYAMDGLAAAWQTFWTAAQPFVEQLDNGQMTM